MAEAFLKQIGEGEFQVESAGLEPGKINPLAVEVMQEVGIDISNNTTKDVFYFFKEGRIFEYVITVCDAAAAERCPIFPGVNKRISWSFEDPSSFTGTYEEKLTKARIVRDKIKAAIKQFAIDAKTDKFKFA